jgi:hypothetical protein
MRKIYLKTVTAIGISVLSLGALASPSHDPARVLPTAGGYTAQSLPDHNSTDANRIGKVMAANEGNYNDTSRGMN